MGRIDAAPEDRRADKGGEVFADRSDTEVAPVDSDGLIASVGRVAGEEVATVGVVVSKGVRQPVEGAEEGLALRLEAQRGAQIVGNLGFGPNALELRGGAGVGGEPLAHVIAVEPRVLREWLAGEVDAVEHAELPGCEGIAGQRPFGGAGLTHVLEPEPSGVGPVDDAVADGSAESGGEIAEETGRVG